MPTCSRPKPGTQSQAYWPILRPAEAGTLLLGQGSEAPTNYYSLSATSRAEIGVISSGLGTEPAAALLEHRQRVLVGHDTWVTAIMIDTLAVVSTLGLAGVFYEFLPIGRDDEVVVIHEVGALRIDGSGTVKWSVDSDVLSGWRLDEKSNLIMTMMDGALLAVSLESGATSS